jgi:hypothetical protein
MIAQHRDDDSVILINQSDAKLSGRFAAHWGNGTFAAPRPYESCVCAVFHDAGTLARPRHGSSLARISPRAPATGHTYFTKKCLFFTSATLLCEGIVLADPIFQAFRKKHALPTIRTLNEAPHRIPPQIARESYRANHIRRSVFTQPRSKAEELALSICCPFIAL